MGTFLSEPGSLAFQVRTAWLGLRGALNAQLKAYGLSTPQYATLMILEAHPGSSNSDVARACAATRQAANEMLAAFERDGLIERRPHPGDRRTHQLFLTDAGRRRLAEARVAAAAWETEIEAGFSDEERAVVRKWLEGVYGACALSDEG
ncbi:MAG: MarR family transcriptional regulator [Hamadaea sp.]|uniref:MarR family winged helix-turn-helix transcriptional regulator n=1 Tax=Hamadaea sp. NPDC050747 TaxID=3155789 RepID=UPI0017E351DF|nr:MarR family transcriptional regulator [Nonomuraea sp.]NUR46836.1 MarR family transcriptional regulator [Hamadaea sp.]NUT07959.1 MarR family transcriptional regulator [Hamadaea sp.]